MTSEKKTPAGLPTQFPAALETAKIDGLSIRYARAARADADTLLLLSPWPESIFAFLPTWARFTEHYDVLALDLPGFGRSEGRPEVIAPEAMGDFIAEAVRYFGLDRPHAIGPDVGTSALLFAAANHPDLFSSITVGSGGAAYPLEVESTLKELIEAPSLAPLEDATAEAFVDAVLSGLEHYTAPDIVREDYIASYSDGRLPESGRFVRLYPKALKVLKERLGEIKTPVLVITGQHDPFVPVSNGQYLVERLALAHLEVVDAGHLVWEDAADAYAGLALDWVARYTRR